MHPVYCLISLSSRYDHHKRVWYFCEASWKGANSARRHPLYSSSMYWSDFYCDNSMKQTTPKYLNGLQHSLSWFWISSLARLAVQGCILRFGFGSGSGQLQFQAERKICCSHCGVGGEWSFKQSCGNLPHLLLLRFRTQKITSTHWPKNLHDWAQNQWRGLLFSINYEPWQEWGSMKNYTLIVTSTTHPFIHSFDALKPKVMTGAQQPLWIMWHWKPQAKMVE